MIIVKLVTSFTFHHLQEICIIVVHNYVFLKLYAITYVTTSKRAILITLTSNMHLDFKGKVIIHVPYHFWNLLLHETLAICSHYLYVVVFHAIFQFILKWTCQSNLHFLKISLFNLFKIKVTLSPPNIVVMNSSYGMSITMIVLKACEVELQNQMATLHQQSLFWIP